MLKSTLKKYLSKNLTEISKILMRFFKKCKNLITLSTCQHRSLLKIPYRIKLLKK